MTLLPRSLLWRTVLVLALLLLLSQVALFTLFRVTDREPRAQQLAAQVASVVNLTRAALMSAQPSKRQALLEELSRREGIRVQLAAPPEPPDHPAFGERPFLRLLRSEVLRQLGADTTLEIRRSPDPTIWVSFRIDDALHWVAIPRARLTRPFPWRWAAWVAMVLALSVLGAILIIARINRPLARLTQAAAKIGRREPVHPVPEGGPSEIAALACAFNDMAAELSRLDADRALLLAGLSHDLRTPLSRLRLGLEMQRDGDPKLRAEMVQDIEDMDRVIGQFLDFARTDLAETRDAAADLNAIVRRAVARCGRAGRPTPTLALDPLPFLPLRPLAMERLVVNLIENAVRHGGGDVEVRTSAVGGQVMLSVLDRGPGIPPADAERLLKPFTRSISPAEPPAPAWDSPSWTGLRGCMAARSN
jgi:two-component system osmolarity sensor histidine kinase EnvZ